MCSLRHSSPEKEMQAHAWDWCAAKVCGIRGISLEFPSEPEIATPKSLSFNWKLGIFQYLLVCIDPWMAHILSNFNDDLFKKYGFINYISDSGAAFERMEDHTKTQVFLADRSLRQHNLKYHWLPKNFREIKGNLRVLSVYKKEALKTKVLYGTLRRVSPLCLGPIWWQYWKVILTSGS